MLKIFENRHEFDNFDEYKMYISNLHHPITILHHLNRLSRAGITDLGVLFDNGSFDSKGCLYAPEMKKLRPVR